MWQFARVIDGMAAACTVLGVPITGGNVSFYNETEGHAVYPTPVVGVVGLIEDAARVLGRVFPAHDLEIVLLGENFGEIGASEYLKVAQGRVGGCPPWLDLAREHALHRLLAALAGDGLIRSAHDCSDGGLAITLAECTFDSGGIGAAVDVPAAVDLPGDVVRQRPGDPDRGALRPDLQVAATLFGESASRAIVTTTPGELRAVLQRAAAAGVPARPVGRTGGSRLQIAIDGRSAIDTSLAEAEAGWAAGLERYFSGRGAGPRRGPLIE
jgi:phosphoribosylformylglycinamidine synthase